MQRENEQEKNVKELNESEINKQHDKGLKQMLIKLEKICEYSGATSK